MPLRTQHRFLAEVLPDGLADHFAVDRLVLAADLFALLQRSRALVSSTYSGSMLSSLIRQPS